MADDFRSTQRCDLELGKEEILSFDLRGLSRNRAHKLHKLTMGTNQFVMNRKIPIYIDLFNAES